jgi:predicted ArsR family transcriptional regulator
MTNLPPDELNAIGVLTRREIEARLLIPLIQALSARFGQTAVLEALRQMISEIARQQGRQLAENCPVNDLPHFASSLENWKKGGAMEIQVVEQNDDCFSFAVRRCRYAEMYQALGVPELGLLLSCSRDFALLEGFNPAIHLTRTHTILGGAESCDFCYQVEP